MSSVLVTWWKPPPDDSGRMTSFLPWLSPGEQARYTRFLVDDHRATFLASRILLRHTLAAVTGQAPAAFGFSTDSHGVKPYLVAPAEADGWHFSLTHTAGLVACTVTRQGDVGIDAESLARVTRIDALAPRVLSSTELTRFASLDETQRRRRFFEYWCVKEAWLKAEGTGLRQPPTSVEVDFVANDLVVTPAGREARLLPIDPAFIVALVHPPLNVPAAEGIVVRAFDWVAVQG